MKKVLLICNYFAPENEIASVRIVKFAKYLKRAGYDVQVLAEHKELSVKDPILENDVEDIPVTRIDTSEWYKKLSRWYNKVTKKYREKHYNDTSSRVKYNKKIGMEIFYVFEMAHPVIGTLDQLLGIVRDLNLAKNSRQYLKKASEEIDVCFSSFGWYFGHLCGSYVKKQNPKVQWIADFTDPVYRKHFGSWIYILVGKIYEHWACKKSDKIVVVTTGMANRLPEKYRKKIQCITNGYDREDLNFCGELAKTNKFVMTYTGRMYGGLQDLSKVFEVVKELINEGIINREKIEFHYAGTGFGVFASQAGMYGLNDLCINHGSVNRMESLNIQAGSDILLVATQDYQVNNVGTLCGKTLEYMMHRKNILAIIQGDVKNNELAIRLRETGIGEAYEETNAVEDRIRIKEYIKQVYDLKMQGLDASSNRNDKILDKYEYSYLTERLICVLEKRK